MLPTLGGSSPQRGLPIVALRRFRMQHVLIYSPPIPFSYGVRSFGPDRLVRWGSSLLSAAGGDYRICWCAGHELDGTPRACEVASDFVVDVGTLSINGPMGGQRLGGCPVSYH